MKELWIDITDIPVDGREFSFSDQDIWAAPAEEYRLGADFVAPFSGTLRVMPQGRAFLVSGSLTGEVTLPCARCTQPGHVRVDERFELFEDLDADREEADGVPLVRESRGKIELDAGTILWEQFVLALPDRHLCGEGCKGLCPQCGADLNSETCTCEPDEGDPRLAVLRGLKVGGGKKN